MTAPIDLAALRALYEAATTGKWRLDREPPAPCEYYVVADGECGPIDVADCAWDYTKPKGQQSSNAAFIVAAHTHWLELLAMAEALEEANHWRARHCEESRLHGEQSQANWLRAQKAEDEKAAMAERLAVATDALAKLSLNGLIATRDAANHALSRIAAHEAERCSVLAAPNEPVLLALSCPNCGLRHIDEGEWATRPHRTHRCVDGPFGKGCGNEWRPAHMYTVGVTNNELEI